MSEISYIGAYHLENLHRQQVRFVFFDLVNAGESSSGDNHTLLSGSHKLPDTELLNYLKTNAIPVDAPIVLISENEANSVAAAQMLEENSFKNVFVVEGGKQNLPSPEV